MRQCDAIIKDDTVVCWDQKRCTNAATAKVKGVSYDAHVCDDPKCKYWVTVNQPKAKFIPLEDK